MLFSSKISALEKTVETLTAERDALLLSSASVTELTDANALCATQHASDQASIATLTTQLSDAAAAKVTADAAAAAAKVTADATTAAAAASLETRVSEEVTKRLAHAGVDPIKRDPGAPTDPNAPKTGTPRQRLAASINAQIAPK
jgi:uncharacterized protein (DUF885 family)